MPKPFDASAKHLLETHPDSWLALIGQGPGPPVRVINAELSTITAEADKVLRVEGPKPWLAHFELQAARDPTLARRLLRENLLLDARHDLPVHSVAILLHSRTDGPEVDRGVGTAASQRAWLPLHFEYQVVRVWQRTVESFFAAGLGTLPLAPLADVEHEALPDILRRLGARFGDEAPPHEAANLWAATQVLMGLRSPPEFTFPLIQGISAMVLGIRGIEESSTYQAILAEGLAQGRAQGKDQGRVEEARRLLLLMGQSRFGPPSPATVARVEAIPSLEQVESQGLRLLHVSG